MIFKYRAKDGRGKLWNGDLAGLQSRDFVDHIFGPLERPLARDERINSTDGSIEKIPPTAEQIAETSEQDQAHTTFDPLKDFTFQQFQALTQTQKDRILYILMKREIRRLR